MRLIVCIDHSRILNLIIVLIDGQILQSVSRINVVVNQVIVVPAAIPS